MMILVEENPFMYLEVVVVNKILENFYKIFYMVDKDQKNQEKDKMFTIKKMKE